MACSDEETQRERGYDRRTAASHLCDRLSFLVRNPLSVLCMPLACSHLSLLQNARGESGFDGSAMDETHCSKASVHRLRSHSAQEASLLPDR